MVNVVLDKSAEAGSCGRAASPRAQAGTAAAPGLSQGHEAALQALGVIPSSFKPAPWHCTSQKCFPR